jgi:hypothetical protein
MALYDGSNAPTLTVEFDLGKIGVFTLGISLLGGTDLLSASIASNWSAVPTSDIRSVAIRRGRTREDQANQPGSLSLVLDNRSGNYDPDNLSSTYIWNGYSVLTRGLGVRVSATWSGTTYVIYRGYLEQIAIDASLDPITTFQFTDALAQIGAYTIPAIASSYSGDTTSARVGRILDAAGWDSSLRNISGARTMQPTTFGNTALALCEQADNCEYGRFFADRQGKLTLLPYESLITAPSRFTLSDTRNSGTIEYDTIKTAPGAKYLVNTVTLNQTSTTSQTAINSTSVIRYGTYQKSVDAPLIDNPTALTLAQIYADQNALPTTRVERVEFDAVGLSTVWSSLLQTDLGDNVNVERTTVDSRSRTFISLVESIDIDITPNNWRVGMNLSPITRSGVFVIGASLLGGTDTLWY